jgi:CelD/BcsL family acetyltransferase involved in cellulose biosynthesis
MDITFKRLELKDLAGLKRENGRLWQNAPLFLLPSWLNAWWETLRCDSELLLLEAKKGSDTVGVIPLRQNGDAACFIGDDRVCDYLDFIVEKDSEEGLYHNLIGELERWGVKKLNLQSLRQDAIVLKKLRPLAKAEGRESKLIESNVSLEMDLPLRWEDYLASLSVKQRHEIKRKLRRLEEAGNYQFIAHQQKEAILKHLDAFITMFKENPRKKEFLTAEMEAFFRKMVEEMTDSGVLNMGILRLNNQDVAVVLYFDYNNNIYLYNSAYKYQYDWLSVGLLSKVLCIKNAIELRKSKFDFLKGAEEYKHRLGGKEIKLYNCEIELGQKSC